MKVEENKMFDIVKAIKRSSRTANFEMPKPKVIPNKRKKILDKIRKKEC